MATHRTAIHDVAVSEEGWARLPGTCYEVTKLAVQDMRHALDDGTPLFARLTYADALTYGKANSYMLLEPDDVEILRANSLELMPYLGTPIAETSLHHSKLHDADVHRQLADWDGEQLVIGDGKYWIAGATPGKSRLMGWDKDGPGPGKAWWQPAQNAHNRHHHDDGTTTKYKRLACVCGCCMGHSDSAPPDTISGPGLPRPSSPGDRGPTVVAWQEYLIGLGYQLPKWGPDGVHGRDPLSETELATRAWRMRGDTEPAPASLHVPTGAERQALFGPLKYKPIGGGAIQITNDFTSRLVSVNIKQLVGVTGGPAGGRVTMHELVADPMRSLWAEWEREGLLHLVLTWQGMWNPRFIRGSSTTLSNHAFGTAFDVNYQWNQFHAVPAARGSRGSVRELVPIAAKHGFSWGGRYDDGTYFEYAGRT